MSSKIANKFKVIVARNATISKKRGKIINSLAKKLGFVYFGSIDRKHDDVNPIRGITTSTTHQDNHFALGSYEGFGIQVVDRFDLFKLDTNKTKAVHWLIIQVDLEDHIKLPHMILYPTSVYNPAFSHVFDAFNGLQPINSLLNEDHTPEFHTRYQLYVRPEQAIYVENYFNRIITQTIATHFWPNAVEIIGDKIYIYNTENDITVESIVSMLKLSTWLADIFDRIEKADD